MCLCRRGGGREVSVYLNLPGERGRGKTTDPRWGQRGAAPAEDEIDQFWSVSSPGRAGGGGGARERSPLPPAGKRRGIWERERSEGRSLPRGLAGSGENRTTRWVLKPPPAEAPAGWAVRPSPSGRPRAGNPLYATWFAGKRSFPIDSPLLFLIGAATLLSRIFWVFPSKFWREKMFKKRTRVSYYPKAPFPPDEYFPSVPSRARKKARPRNTMQKQKENSGSIDHNINWIWRGATICVIFRMGECTARLPSPAADSSA